MDGGRSEASSQAVIGLFGGQPVDARRPCLLKQLQVDRLGLATDRQLRSLRQQCRDLASQAAAEGHELLHDLAVAEGRGLLQWQ